MTSQTHLTWKEHTGPVCHHKSPYTVIACERCGFRHVVPLPTADELTKLYQEQFYQADKPQYFTRYEQDEAWWRLVYRDRFELLEQSVVGASRRLLDIGSGPGLFLRVGAERGWDAWGLEPAPTAVAYSQARGAQVREGFFTADAVRDWAPFDAINLAHVLEHVPNPFDVLDAVRAKLAPNGVVCIVVPNDYNPLQAAAQHTLGLPPWWMAPPHHLSYFDFDSLARLLARCGFIEVARTTTFPMEWFLLMGDNYVDDDTVGRALHAKRKNWETALEQSGLAEQKRQMFRALAQQGWGREVVMIARTCP